MVTGQLITWPAILHYPGQDELEYIASETLWQQDWCQHETNQPSTALNFQTTGRLIDSTGRIFQLVQRQIAQIQNRFVATPSGEFASLHDVIELVRAHAAQSGSCCIAKISASSVSAAIELAGSI